MQGGGGLVEAVDGSACAQFDHLVGDIPELEALQQVDIGGVPVLLGRGHTPKLAVAHIRVHGQTY